MLSIQDADNYIMNNERERERNRMEVCEIKKYRGEAEKGWQTDKCCERMSTSYDEDAPQLPV